MLVKIELDLLVQNMCTSDTTQKSRVAVWKDQDPLQLLLEKFTRSIGLLATLYFHGSFKKKTRRGKNKILFYTVRRGSNQTLEIVILDTSSTNNNK